MQDSERMGGVIKKVDLLHLIKGMMDYVESCNENQFEEILIKREIGMAFVPFHLIADFDEDTIPLMYRVSLRIL